MVAKSSGASRLTVAICTHNRGELLEQSISAAAQECARTPGAQLLVVDNASTDDTAAILQRLRTNFEFESIYEPKQGLSHARNRALATAGTGYTVFLDDDAIVQPGWGAALTKAIADDPKVVVVAGRVSLRFVGTPPPLWMQQSSRCRALLSELDLGSGPRPLSDDESPVGANMAIETAAALAAGGFRADLGRSGRSLASMEEVDLVRRLRGSSRTGVWVPEAAVFHLVPASRVTRRFLLRRAYWQGRSTERLILRDNARDWPRALRKWAAALLTAAKAVQGRKGGPTRFDRLLDAAYEFGRSRQAATGGR